MRLEAVRFASNFIDRYDAMARVLALSAAENSPATPLTIHNIEDSDEDVKRFARANCRTTYIDNARKAKHHSRIIQGASDGEVLCLIDLDTMVLGDLSVVDGCNFDIAYTARPATALWKLNTGVYFVRASKLTRLFAEAWYCKTLDMLADKELHETWKREKRYGGTHQAAFGWMIENSAAVLKLLTLRCEDFNCEYSTLERAIDPRVVHIMGRIREWCFDCQKPRTPNAIRIVNRWNDYAARACL